MLIRDWPCLARCGTCRDWRDGQCWTFERIDPEVGGYGPGSAGQTSSRDACECWNPNDHTIAQPLGAPPPPAGADDGIA